MNEFEEVKRVVEEVEKASLVLQKEVERRFDWKDETDEQFYRSEKNQEERNAILDKLVPDRRCPRCRLLHVGAIYWVINKAENFAVCRSCFQAQKIPHEVSDIFKPYVRFYIDGRNLVKHRETYGISQKKFAFLAGWSGNYQRKLEGGEQVTISEEKAMVILKVLQHLKGAEQIDLD